MVWRKAVSSFPTITTACARESPFASGSRQGPAGRHAPLPTPVVPSNIRIDIVLKKEGFFSLTEISVRGRGKQKGIVIGGMKYEKLPKELLMITCNDTDVKKIVDVIMEEGRTGNIGDGKIFILNVEDAITIRTGETGEKSL